MSPDRLLAALDSLNQISVTINSIGPNVSSSIDDTLRLIVESAIKVVPGTSGVIYAYDQDGAVFVSESRVAAGELADPVPYDEPRPDGMGQRAIRLRRRLLSYEIDDIDVHPAKLAAGAKAAACCPLVVAEQIVGVLYIYLHEDRVFDPLELRMLDNFVNQAAMAIYHTRRVTRVRRDLLRKEEELAHLHRAGLLISSRPRLEDTLEAILQMALEITSARYGIFRLVDKAGQSLCTAAIAGEDLSRPLMEDLRIDSVSITTWVAQHRRPVVIPDLRVPPWDAMYYPLDNDLEMRAELAVPLIGSSGRLEGVLNLESPMVGAFTQEDSYLLQGLATQAVVAIQEVRLLDALQDVAEQLLTRPCREVLVHLAILACDLLNAADSAIWLLDGDRLVLRADSGAHGHDAEIPLQGSLVGRAVTTRQPVISDSVRSDPAFYRRDLAEAHGWARALIVPVLASGELEPLGAFSVYSLESTPGRFAESEWDKKVLITLAHYAALTVQNEAHQRALRAAQDRRTLAETFAALGDVAANVLHQLNNKVGSIPVRVQGIQDKCAALLADAPYLAGNLAEIEKSASSAMQSVRESLALLHPPQPMPVTLAACVADAIATLDLPPDVQVITDGLHDLPSLVVGKQGLTLIFANLIENAAFALEGAGTITIHGAAADGWVDVTVQDTGRGIPPELQSRIFEFNFSRQEASQAGKLGFGLWWVKTLMARLGGRVSVESDGQHGTTFWLRLPLENDAVVKEQGGT